MYFVLGGKEKSSFLVICVDTVNPGWEEGGEKEPVAQTGFRADRSLPI